MPFYRCENGNSLKNDLPDTFRILARSDGQLDGNNDGHVGGKSNTVLTIPVSFFVKLGYTNAKIAFYRYGSGTITGTVNEKAISSNTTMDITSTDSLHIQVNGNTSRDGTNTYIDITFGGLVR